MTLKVGDKVWWVSGHTGEATTEHGVITTVSPHGWTATAVTAKGHRTTALSQSFHLETVRIPAEDED